MEKPDITCRYVIPCPITDFGKQLYSTGKTDLEMAVDDLAEAIVRGVEYRMPGTEQVGTVGGNSYPLSVQNIIQGKGLIYEQDGIVVLGVSTETLIPQKYHMSEAYPNPFNSTTRVRYELPEMSSVRINVYDLNGRLVTTLVNQTVKAGYHSVLWKSNETASGIYMVRMDAKDFSRTRKVTLVK